MTDGIEIIPASDGESWSVFIMLDDWAPNGTTAVQSRPLTVDEARAVALELLEAIDTIGEQS